MQNILLICSFYAEMQKSESFFHILHLFIKKYENNQHVYFIFTFLFTKMKQSKIFNMFVFIEKCRNNEHLQYFYIFI